MPRSHQAQAEYERELAEQQERTELIYDIAAAVLDGLLSFEQSRSGNLQKELQDFKEQIADDHGLAVIVGLAYFCQYPIGPTDGDAMWRNVWLADLKTLMEARWRGSEFQDKPGDDDMWPVESADKTFNRYCYLISEAKAAGQPRWWRPLPASAKQS
jgi:hypothetical protein